MNLEWHSLATDCSGSGMKEPTVEWLSFQAKTSSAPLRMELGDLKCWHMPPHLHPPQWLPFLLCNWQGWYKNALTNMAGLQGSMPSSEQMCMLETAVPLLLLCFRDSVLCGHWDSCEVNSLNPFPTIRCLDLLTRVGPFKKVCYWQWAKLLTPPSPPLDVTCCLLEWLLPLPHSAWFLMPACLQTMFWGWAKAESPWVQLNK